MGNYRNLIAWQKAHELALKIYQSSENFPAKEVYGLTAQLRRAALSVPTNIVEGYNRSTHKDFLRFIDIALGSLAEVEYLVTFSSCMGFMSQEEAAPIQALVGETERIIRGLQKSKRKT